ncbi:MAG: hypothetical protein A2138_25150 [Deltaproteobacteria bacterium RBG_16_71_12]|nr:MAG: hypothetical protein A2138_25150 [Deltaproteobacteria bacterium RBG_16_71_12]
MAVLSAACPAAPVDDADAGAALGNDAGAEPHDDAGWSADDDAGSAPDDAGSTPDDAGPDDPFGRYDRAGPATVTLLTGTVDLGGFSPVELDVYLPSTPGPRPVVNLSPGLLQPRAAYRRYGERLASHGVIVVVRDDPGMLTDTQTVADDIVTIGTSWLAAENVDVASPLFGRVDVSRLGLAGHSRGGKASLIAAEQGLQDVASAWFGLDPVDAAEFSGGAMARDALPSLGMPTGFFGAEVSSSCSPADDNFHVLFSFAPSPSVELVGVGAGHTQLQDQDACVGCAACSPAGSADDEEVLALAVRYLTAFFARELLDDEAVGAGLDGAGAAVDVAEGRITRTTR